MLTKTTMKLQISLQFHFLFRKNNMEIADGYANICVLLWRYNFCLPGKHSEQSLTGRYLRELLVPEKTFS